MPATIPPQAHRLLDEPNFAHLATVMPDGSPQVTPVWVARDGDVVLVNTVKGRLTLPAFGPHSYRALEGVYVGDRATLGFTARGIESLKELSLDQKR